MLGHVPGSFLAAKGEGPPEEGTGTPAWPHRGQTCGSVSNGRPHVDEK